MTPQDLMSLPYAGMAETRLRKSGQWELTREEKIDVMIREIEDAASEINDAVYELSRAWKEAQQ